MKKQGIKGFFLRGVFGIFAGFILMGGCDSGKSVVDEATGKRAVEQYKKAQERVGEIAEKQAERYGDAADDGTNDRD